MIKILIFLLHKMQVYSYHHVVTLQNNDFPVPGDFKIGNYFS